MLKALIGYFNSIKTDQAEMKVTLIEIKKNSQGTSSEVDEAENQTGNPLVCRPALNSLSHTSQGLSLGVLDSFFFLLF